VVILAKVKDLSCRVHVDVLGCMLLGLPFYLTFCLSKFEAVWHLKHSLLAVTGTMASRSLSVSSFRFLLGLWQHPLFIIKHDNHVFLRTLIIIRQLRLILVGFELVPDDEIRIRLAIYQLLPDVILISVAMVNHSEHPRLFSMRQRTGI
jgi:hypothetical protein